MSALYCCTHGVRPEAWALVLLQGAAAGCWCRSAVRILKIMEVAPTNIFCYPGSMLEYLVRCTNNCLIVLVTAHLYYILKALQFPAHLREPFPSYVCALVERMYI